MNDLDPKSVATTKTVVVHEKVPLSLCTEGLHST